MSSARIVVFAIGNRSRGDDALGPLLLDRFQEAWPQDNALEVFQLQPEHALDLCEADMALFIDAAHGLKESWQFCEIAPVGAASVLSHAMSPEAVLDVFVRTQREAPPPSFSLALCCRQTELGQPLSFEALAALGSASTLIDELMNHRDLVYWRSVASRAMKCKPV